MTRADTRRQEREAQRKIIGSVVTTSRAVRRRNHKMVEIRSPKQVIPGIRVTSTHRRFTCTCGSGWLSMSPDIAKAKDAFSEHMKSVTEDE